MRRLIFKDNKFIEWSCRILISLNIIIPGLCDDLLGYPLNVLLMTVIAFWLYCFKLKLVAIVFLLFALLINFQHWFLLDYTGMY
jgi:hypothetical protein